MILAQPRVAPRGHDGRMPENRLQRREAPALFQPPARERVPQLVDVEAAYA